MGVELGESSERPPNSPERSVLGGVWEETFVTAAGGPFQQKVCGR